MFNKQNILSGNNFSKIVNHVFAQNILFENSAKTIKHNIELSKININDIIFCKSDFILELFDILKMLPEKYNIKIITHESDLQIDNNLFFKKPICIKKWYSININYNHNDLIPIPLGLANDYCQLTLKINQIKNTKKNKLLYINHRINTNHNKRKWIYDHFDNNSWCTIKQPNLNLEMFSQELSEHNYMICPQGNGIDTHRLWECLYSGVIPIIENHITHKNLSDLPILFVNSFKEVTEDLLIKNIDIIQNKNYDMLEMKWWENFIKNNKL